MFNHPKTSNPLRNLLIFFQQHPILAITLATIGFGIALASYTHKNKNTKLTEKSLKANTATPVRKLPGLVKALAPETWPPGHPVSIDDLVYIKLIYYGFDDQEHTGALIMHKDVADDILSIFSELLKHKFPIQEITPIHQYNNDDNVSMTRNNTSAFNCRMITGTTNKFSQHSYGRAVDINPRMNPYVKGSIVLPPNGKEFVDRTTPAKGKITNLVFLLFTQHGWDWGGNWKDLKDFQHFEKRPEGSKRTP